jgi:hypothetical protein
VDQKKLCTPAISPFLLLTPFSPSIYPFFLLNTKFCKNFFSHIFTLNLIIFYILIIKCLIKVMCQIKMMKLLITINLVPPKKENYQYISILLLRNLLPVGIVIIVRKYIFYLFFNYYNFSLNKLFI